MSRRDRAGGRRTGHLSRLTAREGAGRATVESVRVNPRVLRWVAAVVVLVGVIAIVVIGRSGSSSTRVALSAPRAGTTTSTPRTTAPSRAPSAAALPPGAPTTAVRAATAASAPSTTTAPQPPTAPTTTGPTVERPITVASESPPPTAPPPPPQVAIYGDSLTVLSTDRYHEIADGQVDSHIHAFAGASLPDHAKIILADPIDRLVLALGTNDAHRDGAKPWADFFNQLPATKCVVWPKPYEGSNEVKIFNAEVAAILAPHINVHVLDWNAEASAHPEWIGPDHVHYTDEGRIHYAELLKQAALTCP